MKLISMIGLAAFLLGTEAKCKDIHRHARVVLQPWNEDGCHHKAYRSEIKMKHKHCEDFDPARSLGLQYQPKKHDQISFPTCNLLVFDEPKCHGTEMSIPLGEAYGGCNDLTFADPQGGEPRHAGRSAKFVCAAAAAGGKGKGNSTETVTVTQSPPVVVAPIPTVPVITVTPSVPVVVVTETRKPTETSTVKAPAPSASTSTSTLVVSPPPSTVTVQPSTITLTKTSAAGSTSRTFTYTLVTTATESWKTVVV